MFQTSEKFSYSVHFPIIQHSSKAYHCHYYIELIGHIHAHTTIVLWTEADPLPKVLLLFKFHIPELLCIHRAGKTYFYFRIYAVLWCTLCSYSLNDFGSIKSILYSPWYSWWRPCWSSLTSLEKKSKSLKTDCAVLFYVCTTSTSWLWVVCSVKLPLLF